MINKLKRIIHKLLGEPVQMHETALQTPEGAAYSEMVVNDLEEKYADRTFDLPVQLVNFDALLASLVAMDHPAIQDRVTKPYLPDDFEDLGPELGELLTDYMNTHLKLLVNSVLQDYLKDEKIKMSADGNGIKYYTDEEDENIDGLIALELCFRSV